MDYVGENKKHVDGRIYPDGLCGWEQEARGMCIWSRMEDQPQVGVYGMQYSTAKWLIEVEFATIASCASAMYNAPNMGDCIHILVANEVHMYSTALGKLVTDKDRAKMHNQ